MKWPRPKLKLWMSMVAVASLAIGLAIVRECESPDRKERDKYARLSADWRIRVDRTEKRRDYCLAQNRETPYQPLRLNLDFQMGFYDGKVYRDARTWEEEAESLRNTIAYFSGFLNTYRQDLKIYQRRLIIPY